MTVIVKPVAGNKFRLYFQEGQGSAVVAGPRLGRVNPLPFYDFGPRDQAAAVKDAKRLQAYIDREHKVRYVE